MLAGHYAQWGRAVILEAARGEGIGSDRNQDGNQSPVTSDKQPATPIVTTVAVALPPAALSEVIPFLFILFLLAIFNSWSNSSACAYIYVRAACNLITQCEINIYVLDRTYRCAVQQSGVVDDVERPTRSPRDHRVRNKITPTHSQDLWVSLIRLIGGDKTFSTWPYITRTGNELFWTPPHIPMIRLVI